jgi:hypothetical protein
VLSSEACAPPASSMPSQSDITDIYTAERNPLSSWVPPGLFPSGNGQKICIHIYI